MRKKISILPVCAILACMAIVFLWQYNRVEADQKEVDVQYAQASVQKTKLQNQQSELKCTLDEVNTDAFVEKQARTLYGYMKPDEIRFVITNPEDLYGVEK